MNVKIGIPNTMCTAGEFADVNPNNFDNVRCLGCSFFRMCKPQVKPEYSDCNHWISDIVCALNPDKIPENDCEYCECWSGKP